MRRKFPMLRKLILLLGDLVLLLSGGCVALLLIYNNTIQQVIDHYYPMVPIIVVSACLLLNVNGLLSLARKRAGEIMLSLAVTVFNLFIVTLAISFLMREFSYSRSVLVFTAVFQFFFLAVWNYCIWRIERTIMNPKGALIVGSEEECSRIVLRLQAQPQLNYNVRYICTDYSSKPWMKVKEDIDLIIICSDLALKDKAEIVHYCHMNGKQVFLIPDCYELFCSGVDLDKIDDIPVFRAHYLKPTLEQRLLKRLLDIGVSGVAILLLWPVMLLVAIAIKLDSHGPVLYTQVRIGRNEEKFKVYKFRSMRQNAEKRSGPVLAAEKDPRITKVGNFIRATRLDELPQLFNVLFSDMSIVGPRPERPFFVKQFKQDIPEYVYRHNVKPGITGMAQVYGKYNTTPYDKLIYDLIYIQKCNVITDLVIMLQTVRVLATKSSTEGLKGEKCVTDLSKYEINEAG